MLILKGIIIGIGKIIPGVSGSMLAISMGIYQKLIYSINNLFKDFYKNSLFLFKVGLGVIISIVFFSNIINYLLVGYRMITYMFFSGLILGNMIKVKSTNKKVSSIFFIIIIVLGFINIDNKVNILNQFYNCIYYFISGFIDAFAMVIPGISGTALLMMIGSYDKIIDMFSNFRLLKIDFDLCGLFFLGIVFGIFFTSKLAAFLFSKYELNTKSAIYGISIGTVLLMIIESFKYFKILDFVIGIILFIIGIITSKKINHHFDD